MTKASDLRAMTNEELKAALTDLSKELYNHVNEMKRSKKADKPHVGRQLKKDKARLLTVLHEKQSVHQ